ncbi:MAG: hypothetical protein DLM53_11700 [Candidatus Eremiobacter antarcticus]|nr:hypothetical protein [Candidatus Eremiobacteraeota bacterium]MBC5808999.1 hypothetical protein [Candidatus Eremiobacteraeota bacterium]PZR60326.1 MAG: hypothetical protein DLM53_11700 [Candidatus Eremiobacter sp. RRmetagenome_bin22]
MSSRVSRGALVSLCLGAILAAGCGGGNGLGNTIGGNFGAQGAVRLIDASEQSGGPLTLTADGLVINSGIDNSVQIGNYALVNAGTHNFAVQPGGQNSNTSVAASTSYSEVLEGEPGCSDSAIQIQSFSKASSASKSTTRLPTSAVRSTSTSGRSAALFRSRRWSPD